MKTNMFGDPQPANADEIGEALMSFGVFGSDVYADIFSPSIDNEGTKWGGWTAEIRANEPDESGEFEINTLGFETEDELMTALQGAGIYDINFVE